MCRNTGDDDENEDDGGGGDGYDDDDVDSTFTGDPMETEESSSTGELLEICQHFRSLAGSVSCLYIVIFRDVNKNFLISAIYIILFVHPKNYLPCNYKSVVIKH